jgi:hypothetical protein
MSWLCFRDFSSALVALILLLNMPSTWPFMLPTVRRSLLQSQPLHMSKKQNIRPTIDDVERISRGQAAKRRGTGSRSVPHRLNAAERKEWDLAKKRRFLQLRGTGWRKERGDSPLANIYRNYCDAVDIPCISIVRAIGIDANVDHVIVDFSPLRSSDIQPLATSCIEHAKSFTSMVEYVDNSDIEKLGWGSLEQVLGGEPIWRVPVLALVVGFSLRSDSKRFAEYVAVKYAKGPACTTEGVSDSERVEEAVYL